MDVMYYIKLADELRVENIKLQQRVEELERFCDIPKIEFDFIEDVHSIPSLVLTLDIPYTKKYVQHFSYDKNILKDRQRANDFMEYCGHRLFRYYANRAVNDMISRYNTERTAKENQGYQ